MASTPEGKIKRKLDKMLKEEGVWYYNPQAGPFGRSGIPDKVAIVSGRFVGMECKADKTKKPTALQIKCMKEIEMAGGKCFLVYDDATIEEVRQYIHEQLDTRWVDLEC
jgi:Holliday junction resolvase|tara:strand:+ start:97 stop:423 length:327 start_codon:yes stop_codon:yes gene_type:complete